MILICIYPLSPFSRCATAVWHWPYCISVEEKTFENLVKLVEKYWEMKNDTPTPPFVTLELVSLSLSPLSLSSLSLFLSNNLNTCLFTDHRSLLCIIAYHCYGFI